MDYYKLIVIGTATEEQCKVEWEKIISANCEQSNSYDYFNYQDLVGTYCSLLEEHVLVKATLLRLHLEVDDESIQDLRSKGYNIKDSSHEDYRDSLMVAMHRSEHLISRIKMKSNELQALIGQVVTFEEIMAHLTVALPGVFITDDLTLARFNEYKKIIDSRKQLEYGR